MKKTTKTLLKKSALLGMASVFSAQVSLANVWRANIWKERSSAQLKKVEVASALIPQSIAVPVPSAPIPAPKFLPSGLLRYVQVKDMQIKKGKPIIFLMQDIHLNEEAQRNMAGAMKLFIKTGAKESATPLIATEGTTGPFDFSPYQELENQMTVIKIADRFLREGRIGAVEYTGLTIDPDERNKLTALGIEDPKLYVANVTAYRKAMKTLPGIEKKLRQKEKNNQREAKTHLRPKVRKFLQLKNKYNNGEFPLGPYLIQLDKRVPSEKWPVSIQTFFVAYQIEKRLNFDTVFAERDLVFQQLAEKISPEELSYLVARSRAYEAGNVTLADYYQSIKDLISVRGISLRPYPAFEDYLYYLILSDSLNITDLFKDLNTVEQLVRKKLRLNKKEQAILKEALQINLIKDLISFSLTPEKWEELKKKERVTAPPSLLTPFTSSTE